MATKSAGAPTPIRPASGQPIDAWFVNAAMGDAEFEIIADALPHAAAAAKEAKK